MNTLIVIGGMLVGSMAYAMLAGALSKQILAHSDACSAEAALLAAFWPFLLPVALAAVPVYWAWRVGARIRKPKTSLPKATAYKVSK